jgi:hypothetical protein
VLGGAVARVLDAIRDAASGQASQAVERERGPGAVAGQPLAAEVVARGDAHTGVQVEALVLGGEAHPAGSALLRVVGAVVLVARELGERPALHGDRRARLEGARLGRLARAVLRWPAVDVAVAGEPRRDASVDAPRDRLELRGVGLVGRVEEHALLRVAAEDAVEEDGVKMNVQVQAAAEALHKRDRPTLPLLGALAPGAGPIAREDHLDKDAGDSREHVGLERREQAQLVGQREHELTHGHVGQDAIDQVGGGVGHAPAGAARAEAAALAREGHEQVAAARVAMAAREAIREDATAQVLAEFALDVARQRRGVRLARVREEGLERLAHHAVEDGLGRLSRLVGGREAGHNRLGAACQARQVEVSSVCADTPLSGTDPPTDRGQVWRSGPEGGARAPRIGAERRHGGSLAAMFAWAQPWRRPRRLARSVD